jgi:Tfp pilus assembly protein PilN
VIDQLNLASQPFRNRALPWTVATVIAAASVLALVFIVGWGREAQARAARVEQDVQELHRQDSELRAKAQAVSSSLKPEQRLVLDAAHEIVDRKNFSWSRLLADLEAAVPSSVRVARISVRDTQQVNGQTRANLELTIVGKTPADVTRLIGELARTGVFAADLLSQSPRAAKGEPGTEATLRVYYTPRPGANLAPPPDVSPVGFAVNGAQTPRAAAKTP